uniref:Uncharacterized protein n=1 Tax=Arion vulgaris TaxID=1028688 RepID=A0A0B7BVJ7_9EUPU
MRRFVKLQQLARNNSAINTWEAILQYFDGEAEKSRRRKAKRRTSWLSSTSFLYRSYLHAEIHYRRIN